MSILDASENNLNFLNTLHQKAHGDPSFQISMYEIGKSLGLERDEAQKTAEALMGEGLVEIKTLSGGIGITESGISEIEERTSGQTGDDESRPVLSDSLILEESDRQLVEAVIHHLKQGIGNLKLEFNDTADLIVDIKTIELQLTSSTPKTALVRECFSSIKARLEKSENPEAIKQVSTLIGP